MIALLTRLSLIISLACLVSGELTSQAPAEKRIDFNRDVRPILAGHCYTCHGPDRRERRADLRLDTEAGQRADLGGTFAVVPGKPEASELLARVRATGKKRMPPLKTGEGLSQADIATLERWIAQGAPFARHWSFVKPERPRLPAKPNRPSWSHNPIDRFVAVGHANAKLTPAPEADKATLLRRVTLDLTGVPPTADDAAKFLADTAPGAYERLVDRLLARQSYGEHMARHWLDLARYADSAGYADDPKRTIWGYRDWVIRAFNDNQPFDQFTIDQLAGDLMANPTERQLVATAFHRNTMTNNEGGTDDEEFRSVAVVDRVNTTMSVWMGSTLACAQCHDHKYDPFSQAEYFQLYGFFNNTEDSDKRNERPTLPLLSREQIAQQAAWRTQLKELDAEIAKDTPELTADSRAWAAALTDASRWRQASLVAGKRPGSFKLGAKTGRISALRITGAGRQPIQVRRTSERLQRVRARYVRVTLRKKSEFLSLAEVQVFAGSKNVARRGKARQSSTSFRGPARLAIDGNTNGNFSRAKSTTHTSKQANPWWEVDLRKEHGIDKIALWNRTDGVGDRLSNYQVVLLDAKRRPVWSRRFAATPKPSVTMHPSGKGRIDTIVLGKDPKFVILAQAIDTSESEFFVDCAPKAQITVSDHPKSAEFEALPKTIRTLLQKAPATRTAAEQQQLATHYREIAPRLAPLRQRRAALRKKIDGQRPMTTVPIMRELAGNRRRKTHVHIRGNFMNKGKEVQPDVPATWPALPKGATKDRLALAKWLVSPENPLTARVTVNRFWELLFGIGLVATSEDFGSRGEQPSHPELLDWLATEFQQKGWDVKALLRLIVTSATYRQDSRADASLRQRDPRNRLLARGPRLRLSAEMIRDQALTLSGLRSDKMYGPPVRPPRPSLGLRAAFGGSTDWKNSSGPDRYRRGIYTFWQRSIPYPSMAAFDAPSREVCTVRREPTNTPLQALVTLNDPVYVEAAQALARRILRDGGATDEARAAFGWQLCLVRHPNARELDRLVALVAQARQRFAKAPQDATALATKPLGPAPAGMAITDLAAWTVAANVLLNLDEIMVKR